MDSGGNNRAEGRAHRTEGKLDTAAFLKVADKFIDVANRENRSLLATDLHMAFFFAAAHYNAHIAKVVVNVKDHEQFVEHMAKQHAEMVRHLRVASLVAA